MNGFPEAEGSQQQNPECELDTSRGILARCVASYKQLEAEERITATSTTAASLQLNRTATHQLLQRSVRHTWVETLCEF
jgi:hypothetical protein